MVVKCSMHSNSYSVNENEILAIIVENRKRYLSLRKAYRDVASVL